MKERFQQEHPGKTLCPTQSAEVALLHEAEAAKCALSTEQSVTIRVPGVLDNGGDWELVYHRAELDDLFRPTVMKTLTKVQKVLTDAKRSVEQVEQVVLAGGTSSQCMQLRQQTPCA